MVDNAKSINTVLIVGRETIKEYFYNYFKKNYKNNINIVHFYTADKYFARQVDFIGNIDLAIIDIYQNSCKNNWFDLCIKIHEQKDADINILLARNGHLEQFNQEINLFLGHCFQNKEIFSNLIEECINIDEYQYSLLAQYLNLKFKKDYYKKLSSDYLKYLDENQTLKGKIESLIKKEKESIFNKEADKKFIEDTIMMLHDDLSSNANMIEIIKNKIESKNPPIDEIIILFGELKDLIKRSEEKISIIKDMYCSNQENITRLEECFRKVSIDLRKKLDLNSLTIDLEPLKEHSIHVSPNIVHEIISHYLSCYLLYVKKHPPKNGHNDLINIKPKKIGNLFFLQIFFSTDKQINFSVDQFIENIISQLKINVTTQFCDREKMHKINIVFPKEMLSVN